MSRLDCSQLFCLFLQQSAFTKICAYLKYFKIAVVELQFNTPVNSHADTLQICRIFTQPEINDTQAPIVGILTFLSMKNNIPGLSEPKKAEFLHIFILSSI